MTIDDMKWELAKADLEGFREKDLIMLLIDGCPGYDSMMDEDVVELYNEIFGEEE